MISTAPYQANPVDITVRAASIPGWRPEVFDPVGPSRGEHPNLPVSERMRTAAYNIRVGGVSVTIAYNEIHDAPHQAILLSGNDHTFE